MVTLFKDLKITLAVLARERENRAEYIVEDLPGQLPDIYIPDEALSFQLIEGGTNKGKDLLCDNQGHRYCLKSVKSDGITPNANCCNHISTQQKANKNVIILLTHICIQKAYGQDLVVNVMTLFHN